MWYVAWAEQSVKCANVCAICTLPCYFTLVFVNEIYLIINLFIFGSCMHCACLNHVFIGWGQHQGWVVGLSHHLLITMYGFCVRSLLKVQAHWHDSGLSDWPWVTNFRTLEVKALMYALRCILFSGSVYYYCYLTFTNNCNGVSVLSLYK